MKIERTTKLTLETADQHAIATTLDIISEIVDKMEDDDTLAVYEEVYDRDWIEEIKCFLADLKKNGNCACEIVKG